MPPSLFIELLREVDPPREEYRDKRFNGPDGVLVLDDPSREKPFVAPYDEE